MLSNKIDKQSIIFVLLFVLQQFVAFCWSIPTLVSPYWLIIYITTLIILGKLKPSFKESSSQITFALFFILGAFTNVLSGSSIGYTLQKTVYMLVALTGFLYIKKKRVNLYVFYYLFAFLYVYFYSVYFSQKNMYEEMLVEGELFGHSSSNTIPILLCNFLFILSALNRYYKQNQERGIFILSVSNAILITIQGSRTGLIVAFIQVFLSYYDLSKAFRISRFLRILMIASVVGVIIMLLKQYAENISDYLSFIGIGGNIIEDTYEADVRSWAQLSFFTNLDFQHLVFGYPENYSFALDIHRTFNSFLDIWSRYGFWGFSTLIIAFFKRLKNRKQYCLPLYYFIPVFFYSLTESIYAGGFFDIIWFLILFL